MSNNNKNKKKNQTKMAQILGNFKITKMNLHWHILNLHKIRVKIHLNYLEKVKVLNKIIRKRFNHL